MWCLDIFFMTCTISNVPDGLCKEWRWYMAAFGMFINWLLVGYDWKEDIKTGKLLAKFHPTSAVTGSLTVWHRLFSFHRLCVCVSASDRHYTVWLLLQALPQWGHDNMLTQPFPLLPSPSTNTVCARACVCQCFSAASSCLLLSGPTFASLTLFTEDV